MAALKRATEQPSKKVGRIMKALDGLTWAELPDRTCIEKIAALLSEWERFVVEASASNANEETR